MTAASSTTGWPSSTGPSCSNPGDYAVRLYLGTVQLQYDDNAAGAVAQYRHFLADGPPATLVQQAAPEIRNAYQQAGLAVPAVGGRLMVDIPAGW